MPDQMLDVAIALLTVFFFVAVTASAIVELVSLALSKRSRDLDRVIGSLLTDSTAFKATAVYDALARAANPGRSTARTPTYIPARSFADAVIESTLDVGADARSARQAIDALPDSPLKRRLSALYVETGGDLTRMKAGLESWFDASMSRLQGAYKRWSSWALLVVGMAIAVTFNVSATRIADTLWSDDTLRSALVDAAPQIADGPCPDPDQDPDCSPQDKLSAAYTELTDAGLPIGWGPGWAKQTGPVWTLLGWLPIAIAAKAGAPFWFGLILRVSGLRSGRGEPPPAAADDASHTRAAINGLSSGTLDDALQQLAPPAASPPTPSPSSP